MLKLLSCFALAALALLALESCASPGSPVGNSVASNTPSVSLGESPPSGRALFLRNCAHCHAADATGDEGPDLHRLDESDAWIAKRIRDGRKGRMTAFGGKLTPAQIDSLVAYLRTLK